VRRRARWRARTIRDRGANSRVIVFAGLGEPRGITVVIPVRNCADHLPTQLAALAGQTYRGDWEVVVADNGSTDETVEVARAWADRMPSLRVINASGRRGPNHARNVGARAARAELLAYCDADDVASARWLEALAQALQDADLVGGRLDWSTLNDPTILAWRPQRPMTDLLPELGFLRYAPSCNLGVRASVVREIGWDERFVGGSCDQPLAWRAQLAGYRLAFASDAVMQQRFRSSMRATARQFYGYGWSGPQLYRAFREAGVPPPDNRDALRLWGRLGRQVPDLWGSRARRGHWVRSAAFRLGRVTGSLRHGVVCL
jgi:glycosyltransferase involved in cell wall biosynthesis